MCSLLAMIRGELLIRDVALSCLQRSAPADSLPLSTSSWSRLRQIVETARRQALAYDAAGRSGEHALAPLTSVTTERRHSRAGSR